MRYCHLNELKNYIDKYQKLPSCNNKNKEISELNKWIKFQQYNCKKDKNNAWIEFINSDKYKQYFINE